MVSQILRSEKSHDVLPQIDITGIISPLQRAYILSALNEKGAIVLQFSPLDDSRKSLISLTNVFGKIVHHTHSDADGVVAIQTNPSKIQYISANSQDSGMHTDNTFGHQTVGVAALQCIKAAENEGLSKLVYGRAIYDPHSAP